MIFAGTCSGILAEEDRSGMLRRLHLLGIHGIHDNRLGSGAESDDLRP